MRSGYINTLEEAGRQLFRWASYDGYGWAASPSTISSAKAYRLTFNVNDVNLSYGPDASYFGHPLRCLSTTAVGTASTGSGSQAEKLGFGFVI